MTSVRTLALAALALLAAAAPHAQATYTVTFEAAPFAYALDGTVRQTLTLVRGQTYTFQLSSIPSNHPFYISTSATGGGAGVYSDGVTGGMSTGNATVTFTVPMTAPNQLYYQCGVHQGMGASLTIVSPSSTDVPPEGAALSLALRSANPSAVDAARVAMTLRSGGDALVQLVDARGRLVATLWDGPAPTGSTVLDVPTAGLAAGTYLVRARSAGETVWQSLTVVR